MADWLDYLASEISRPRPTYRPQSYRAPMRTRQGGGGGYHPLEVGRSSSMGSGASRPASTAAAYTPAGPPERFDFSLPFTKPESIAPPKPQPPKSTEGDILGSIGGAIGNVAANVNIANAIPWLMERINKAAGDYARSNEGSPLGAVAQTVDFGTGAFLGAVQTASDVAGPVLDAVPNWFRDNHLKNRAKLYQALVTGEDPDFGPFDLGAWELTLPFTANTQQALAGYQIWKRTLEETVDPEKRMEAQTRLAIIRDSIDLPEAVKAAIRADPRSVTDDDFQQIITSSLDGNGLPRAWSYDPGLGGVYANAAYPLSFYAGEAVLGSAALTGVKGALVGGVSRTRFAPSFGEAPTLVARPTTGLAQRIGGRGGAAIEGAVNIAARGGSAAAKVQAASLAAGAGLTGITTTMDAIARWAGNEEAVAWFERLNEPTDFAENPNVQLVTGFSVNPLTSIGLLRRGIVRMGDGASVVVGRATGRKLAAVYDDETVLYGVLAKMYRLPGWQDAQAFAHGANERGVPYYADKGEAYEQVLESAADYVLDRLPKQERIVLNATHKGDQAGLQRAVLSTYGDAIEDAIRHHSDEVAQRFYAHAWQYHQYTDAFDPNVAAQNALDMRRAKVKSQEFRDRQSAVVGYTEYLAPEGATLARQFADQWTNAAGQVRRGGVASLDDLIRMFPSLRKYWKGLVDPKSPTISRANLEEIIVRAERDYADAAKQNPVHVRTGADPVLRPDSPSLDRDYAEALGTDVATVKAIGEFNPAKPDAAAIERLRSFLADKTGSDPADLATMAPEEVWTKASDYVDTTTAPWRAAGDRVVAAEKELTRLRTELRRLHAIADPSRRSAENVTRLAELDQEIPALEATDRALRKANRKSPTTEGLEAAASAKAKLDALKAERTSLRRISEGHRTMAHAEAIARTERQIQQLQTLVREASDPIRPFSEEVRIARLQARQAERVKAMDADRLSTADIAFLERYLDGDYKTARASNVTPADLLERAREIADEAVPLVRRDAVLAERAARKVRAQQVLDEVEQIDAAATALEVPPNWLSLLRRVEGNWRWKGGGPEMPAGIRTAIGRWADKAGRGALAREIRTMGDEEAWVLLTDHPEITETLTRTQRNAVLRARADGAGRPTLDQYAERAIRTGQVRTSEEFLERLVDLAEHREQIIDGALTERNLRRTAGMEVPADYLEDALAAEGNMEWAAIYDADFTANVHPRNVGEVAKILDNPDELFPALRPIVESDPILDAAARSIAAEKGVTLEVLLRDRTFAPSLRPLVPEGFEAPVPGVRAETGLDDLIIADDQAAVASRSQELMGAAAQPREPIRTTVSAARRAHGTPHPSKEWGQRIREWGVDQTAGVNATILDDPANRVGVDVLSVLNGGTLGRPPRTVRGVLNVLIELEHGSGVQMGLGASVQAEAQRVANELLRDAIASAKRGGFRPGVFEGGLDAAAFMADDMELAASIQMRDAREALNRTLQRDVQRSVAPERVRPVEPMVVPDSSVATFSFKNADDHPFVKAAPGGDPNVAYHVTPAKNLDAIRKDGLRPTNPPDQPEAGSGVFLASDAVTASYIVPRGNAADAVILRVKRDPATMQNTGGIEENALGMAEYVSREAVPPSKIEYWGADGAWHPLVPPTPEAIVPGMEAASQAANRTIGVLRGGSAESGGAVRESLVKSFGKDQRRNLLRADTIDITFDSTDPLGTLQYGFKRRPNDAVVLELSRVPGLAEEFAAGRFVPWAERVGTTHARRAFNWVFGPTHNTAVAGAVRQRFVDRAAAQGIDAEVTDAIWQRWSEESRNSRKFEVRVHPRTKVREHLPGDNPLYATVGNIPNHRMDLWAHEAVDDVLRRREGVMADPSYLEMAHTIDYAALFREASSFTRRTLRDRIPNKTLGKELADAYGMVFHNEAVTTLYYWFRFALDVRYHAMNFFEAQLLYLGRAGLRQGELDQGLLGQTEGFLRSLDTDMVNNTGYASSRSRFAFAYRTFLKEQPAALRSELKGLQAEDPALMRQAIDELAAADPELRSMIRSFGDTPEGWMRAMDDWHGKMLRTATETEAGVVIDQALAKVMADTPAMAEVYGKLAQVNKGLWSDVRATFYGNAQRSRAERFLNSYLLFWPLSYQVKATKWLLRTMFDRAGGLPTNAAGAVMLDRVAQTHQELLVNDPEYGEWFEQHPTLVFIAQMLVPITPSSMGVSLNPGLRSLFFGRTKAVWDIGPVYTTRHVVPQLGEEVGADLWPTIRDIPGMGGIYRAATGRQEPDYLQD